MPEQGTHFWFMTIQTPNAGGYYLNSYQGTITPRQGSTRLDLFNRLVAEVHELDPKSQGGAAIAFDVQPNRL